ncbi:sensor histidine kinase [Clostridium gasigenes]|uniref:histidine kinase n=1 Tax=Clostridium gasigenes TaxID=94869 RepID=A0A7X0SGX7_9CLOT|nr:HAMP domain-containing sensor histidine kinase [Clostridium gasigenes]MBB6716153.1 GHKL domain-containing protein [Clostridium gasigenes]
MSKSISKKIFTITFGLILTLIVSSILFQLLFFERFYFSKKTNQLVHEVNNFRTLYAYQISDNISLSKALSDYEHRNNSKIAIFSTNGIYIAGGDNQNEDAKTLTAFCSELLSNKTLINEVLSSNKTKTTVFKNAGSDNKKIGVIAPMSLSQDNDSLIISVSPTQPIEEAALVIRDFYKYLIFGFLLLGIFLAYLYANLISKPLLKINKVAIKMSSMDFSAKCEVNSEDEIGYLGKTLNFLSSNLKDALTDLKNKNKKLEDDIDKERKLENLRKDFVAGVSHELKTPIGIIEGYAEGIRDGIVSGKDLDLYIETIIDESHKMSKLVSDMLELSKLESGTIELNIENFNILRLINKIINKHTLNFKEKEIKVVFNYTIPYAYVKGDIFQLDQVLTNLFTNALKYTPSGETVIISVIDKNSDFLISIENTGASIPNDELENIYSKFYRIDKSRKRTDNSTGLGLSIVERILNLHKSAYTIKNTNSGVDFSFTLSKGDSSDCE